MAPAEGPEEISSGRSLPPLCHRLVAADAVVCACPVEDDDAEPHTMTVKRRGECDNMAISCSGGHKSAEVREAAAARRKISAGGAA